MTRDAEFHTLMHEEDGSYTACYGPFRLRSAFQPIYSQSRQGVLKIEAYEALVRPSKGEEPVPPAQFFAMVEAGDGPHVERLCRRLHVLNAAHMEIGPALLLLNFDPASFTSYAETLREIQRFTRVVRRAKLSTSQIVCEIIETETDCCRALRSLTEILREHKLKIAIDDYGADGSDFARLISLRPDIVKFDGPWVHRFLETAEGFALLKIMVQQFRDRGIQTLFEGLEEHWHISACRDLGVRLLQGYALAMPRLIPDKANAGHREEDTREAAAAAEVPSALDDRRAGAATCRREAAGAPKPRAVFGRRGL